MYTGLKNKMNTGLKDKLILSICGIANQCGIEKVILFGSRATGKFYKTSDIDLAVTGGNIPLFSLDVDENTPTLLEFDIVDLDLSVQPELLDAINSEGIVLYEKI